MPPVLAAGLCLLLSATPLLAINTDREDVRAFVEELRDRHGFDAALVEATLADSQTKQKILDAISRPAEKTKPWFEYRQIFMTDERIAGGLEFIKEHRELLDRVAAETGVPAEMIAAIIGVETYYGRRTGSYRVLDALSTLGFDYPPRAKFFRSELMEFFLLAREEGLGVDEIKGSYAGAMGPPQFIPSSYRAYAVDGDGDGQRDLLGNWDDVIASVANYFVAHRWAPGQPVAALARLDDPSAAPAKNTLKLNSSMGELRGRGISADPQIAGNTKAMLLRFEAEDADEFWVGFQNFYVITRYNRSPMYALAVFQLSQALAQGPDATAEAVARKTP
ncbi:MAG: lytic murein transglycosylase B [Gammaproteobacteria bacterium]